MTRAKQTSSRAGPAGKRRSTGKPRRASDPRAPRKEHGIRLADGRRLGVAEFGDREGTPILWFHGTPGARRQIPVPARVAAAERGLRLLGIERPGIGWSTPHLYDSVLGWARDIEELADRPDVPGAAGSELDFLRKTALTALSTSDRLEEVTSWAP